MPESLTLGDYAEGADHSKTSLDCACPADPLVDAQNICLQFESQADRLCLTGIQVWRWAPDDRNNVDPGDAGQQNPMPSQFQLYGDWNADMRVRYLEKPKLSDP